jgi:carboxyl-terminal processing protease
MKSPLKPLLFLLSMLLVIASCKKDENNDIEIVNREIYDLMKDVYLWDDHLPNGIDPGAYSTPESFMEALRYPTYDKWSFVMAENDFIDYFVNAEMIGHGFMLGLDESEKVRVCFLYRLTQAADEGVKRGWILSKVNGTNVTPENIFTLLGASEAGVTNNIIFLDENGATVNLNLTKEVINITPVLHYEVLNQGGLKIGYMVFQDFISAAYEELDEVFAFFANQDIEELIVDLRYNGGGSVDVADTLAGWLIGDNFRNEPFVNFEYNAKYARGMNKTIDIPAIASGLNLSKVFFIGTTSTASASELIINGVKSYVPSILAGSTTHGKPVGMNVFQIKNYMVLPITFKYTNADGEGDFYNGLEPALPAADDITRNFGDPEEASLKAILDYIETGAVPVKTTKTTGYRAKILEPRGPLGQYLKAY